MPNFNSVHLLGHVGKAPEISYTPSGTALAKFSLAVSRKWKNKSSGEMQEETTWVDCEAWDKTAEVIEKYVGKGSPLFVNGRIKQDTWTDKESGKDRSKLKVVIENIQLLGVGKETPKETSESTEPQQTNNAAISEDNLPF